MDASTNDSGPPNPPKGRWRRLILAVLFVVGAVTFAAISVRSIPRTPPGRNTDSRTSPGEPGKNEEVFEGIRQSMATFKSNGATIRIEMYLPGTPGRHPAIVVLHGGGPANLAAQVGLRTRCRDFARRGYVALFPRYFDQTDTELADPPTIDRNFVAWMGTVSNALEYARNLPEVDPDRVGLIGWSLGSSLALEVAATNPHSAAVVGNVGGMAHEVVDKITRMPPTLLLDGGDDPNYPARLARDLYRSLRAKHVNVESKIYPGQGHGFGGDAARDAYNRTDAFFDKYLARRTDEGAERKSAE
jgi:carboxymethylenebutenolidase